MPLNADGKKFVKLSGKWNEYCDMVKCNEDGSVPEGLQPRRLWTCTEKPKSDYYSFTHFAHKLNSSEGIRMPLPSDSRCVRVLLGSADCWGCMGLWHQVPASLCAECRSLK